MSSSDDAPVFEFGDRTVLQLRNQTFAPGQEEFGTIISTPAAAPQPEPAVEQPVGLATLAIPLPAEAIEDPMVRLELKVDAALQAIAHLQQRLESLDATLARVLMR